MNPENYGVIYAGTHGRGIFRSDDFFSVDVAENNGTGVDGNDVSLSVYPNPTTNTAFVNLNVTSTVNQAYVQVYNVNGQLVKNVNVGQLTPGTHKIDLGAETLATGTYVVKTFAGNASGTAKFIKQ
jgi:flagellar hook assembly protein FlgD